MIRQIAAAAAHPRRSVRSVFFNAARVFGSAQYRKFVVLTRPRTGSNMLIKMLNSHPQIVAQGELFKRLNGGDPKEVISGIFCRYPHYIKAAGFKLMYNHPDDARERRPEIWDSLRQIDGLAIIHLKRRNTLRAAASMRIAKQKTGEFSRKSSISAASVEERRVAFTAADLLQEFERTREWERKVDYEFRELEMLNVTYEDFVLSPQDEGKRVTAFLGVRPHRLYTELQRQNPERLKELIGNYDELKTTFADTLWASFFED